MNQRHTAIARMQKFSYDNKLLPWDQVAEQWNMKSGETLTRSRVWQIAMEAQEKIKRELARELDDTKGGHHAG
jgi:hypothetical protein